MLTFDRLCMGCMNDNGGEEICPICSHNASTLNPFGTLPIKSRIQGRYIIGKALEINGEGITYIGWDSETNSIINIREFFPVPLAKRDEHLKCIITEGNEYYYNAALLDFVDLAKKLKELKVAAAPQICDIIECNNTAYVISKAAQGITLREFLLRNGGTLSWEQAKSLFMPLVSAISALHKAGIIHGGISPETIIVGRDGKLRLSGFSILKLRKAGSPINSQVFPGYAAAEQYGLFDGEIDESTDVYGFAATLFRVLIGSALPEANERVTDDKMNVPSKVAETLPAPVLTTLADALQITKENRTANMDELKIDISPAIDMTTSFTAITPKPEKEKGVKTAVPVQVSAKKKDNSAKKAAVLAAVITAAAILLIVFIVWLFVEFLPSRRSTTTSSDIDSTISSSSEESSSIPSQKDELLITVPDFSSGELTFEDLLANYPEFKFEVLGKKYSNKEAGIVVDQDYKPGSEVKRDSTIYVTLSLGPNILIMPDLEGQSYEEALITLFKAGFSYKNITFYEIEDSSVGYHYVVKSDPKSGDSLSPDDKIVVYYSNVRSNETGNQTDNNTNSSTVNTSSEEQTAQ